MASTGGHPGIDLEVIAERPASFAATWFRPEERKLTGSDPRLESQVWAIKEAVLKSLGTGMRLSPLDVVVVQIGLSGARVELRGEALDRHQAMGAGAICIGLGEHKSMVVATAWMAS
jgi:phosphopantetheinyl transferase (holo-ACP synthase)